MLRRLFIIAIVMLALPGAADAAETGTWTMGGGVYQGQFPLLMDIGAIDADHAFILGINQVGAAGFEWGWTTDDGGTTLDLTGYDEVDLEDPCQAMILFNSFTHLAADFFDATNGVMVGMAMPEDCIETNPFPACWGCMFLIGPKTWRSTDGGVTWEMQDIDWPEGTVGLTQVETIDETTGFLMGDPNKLFKTTDAGDTWDEVTPPFNYEAGATADLSFLTPELGFAATGYQEIEEAISAFMTPAEYAENVMFRRSALLRHERDLLEGRGGAKAPVIGEGLFKTEDGGATWIELAEGMNYLPYKISMGTEQHGAIITSEEYSAKVLNTIRYTDDGGATWNEATIPDPMPMGNGAYAISDIWMVDGNLGFAACDVSVIAFSAHTGAIIKTEDGGKTWEVVKGMGSEGAVGGGFIAMDEDRVSKEWAYAVGLGEGRVHYEGLFNGPPTADAGVDGEIVVGAVGTLDGSASTDTENDTLSYKWVQIAGEAVTMPSAFGQTNTFTPAAMGTVTFELTVGDGEFMDTDEVSFNVVEGPPTDDDADDDSGDDDSAGDDDSGDDDDAGADDDSGAGDDDDDDGGCCG